MYTFQITNLLSRPPSPPFFPAHCGLPSLSLNTGASFETAENKNGMEMRHVQNGGGDKKQQQSHAAAAAQEEEEDDDEIYEPPVYTGGGSRSSL